MKKELLENQALREQMLFFDPPERWGTFKRTAPPPDMNARGKSPFAGGMPPMEIADIEPGVKVLEDGSVRFRFYAPEASSVEVAGIGGGFSRERRALTKGADGWWSAVVTGIPAGFHYHEYFVDGNRLVNPDAQCGFGCFYGINFFDIPSDEDEFWMLRDVPHGDVRMEYYKSSVTGRTKCAWVYAPAGYDAETCSYPVLYIQHGVGESESGWVWQGRLNLIADNLIADGKCGKLLIVMNAGYAFKPGVEEVFFPGDFDSELVNDCIPHIEGKYRVLADKHHRAVAGLSLGSAQAFLSAMKNRDVFGSLGVFSGGFPVKRSEYDYTGYFSDAAKVNADFDLIFVSGGEDEGFLEHTQPIVEALTKNGVKIETYHRPGYHVWDVWRFSAREFLQKLFEQGGRGTC